jgi:hypothetical protein
MHYVVDTSLFHALCSYTVFSILHFKFADIVLPGLALDGADKKDSAILLERLIVDVLVTRNGCVCGTLSVVEARRGMQSLLGTLPVLNCDPSLLPFVRCAIEKCLRDIDDICAPVALSVTSITCLFFTRALQRLCKAINVADLSWEALAANGPMSQEMRLVKECVWNGRWYLYHGKYDRKSMALLVCTCAVSRLLRSLDSAFAVDADACDADVMQLLARMQLCDEQQLLQAIALGHQTA